MVQGLNGVGQRVVIDVVYNHTPAAGQDPKSILDRIVPGYYHRLSPTTGQVETSTCCANTATEHAMMEKLMIDSVLTWARDYKVDGFRFDLMGHQPKSSMIELRRGAGPADAASATASTAAAIYMYGEGWNFGEVANNARFVQATQTEMAGTGIGTFNDRLRDARARRRAVRREPADPGLRQRAVHRPERRPGQRDAEPSSGTGCCSTRTGSRSG